MGDVIWQEPVNWILMENAVYPSRNLNFILQVTVKPLRHCGKESDMMSFLFLKTSLQKKSLGQSVLKRLRETESEDKGSAEISARDDEHSGSRPGAER